MLYPIIKIVIATALCVTFCTSSGCNSLQNIFRPKDPKAPPLITTSSPSLAEITSAINRNSAMIRNMSSESATIMVPGVLLRLNAKVAFERPKRLRIQAGAGSLTGQELDFGSNDSIFWLWVRRWPTKEIYYCSHDLFPSCPIRNAVPIDPNWMIEALGIVEFSPTEQHEGPIPQPDGNLLIITRRQTPSGMFLKHTIIDAKMGWILRQEVYSPQNELMALAVSSDHRYDRGSGIYYAQRVEIQCQGAEGKMTLELGTPKFNQVTPFPSAMFTLPTIEGYKPVDICAPEFLQNNGTIMPLAQNVGVPSSVLGTTTVGATTYSHKYQAVDTSSKQPIAQAPLTFTDTISQQPILSTPVSQSSVQTTIR